MFYQYYGVDSIVEHIEDKQVAVGLKKCGLADCANQQ